MHKDMRVLEKTIRHSSELRVFRIIEPLKSVIQLGFTPIKNLKHLGARVHDMGREKVP